MQPVPSDPDRIHIEQLEVAAHVGVSETERATSQRLTISLTLWPQRALLDCADKIERTVNYSKVCAEVKTVARARCDKLIETLANEIASHLLRAFAIEKVQIEIRKYISDDLKYVSVILTRGQK